MNKEEPKVAPELELPPDGCPICEYSTQWISPLPGMPVGIRHPAWACCNTDSPRFGQWMSPQGLCECFKIQPPQAEERRVVVPTDRLALPRRVQRGRKRLKRKPQISLNEG